MEIWKDIKDYEGLYKVSNLGRVKNSKGAFLKFRITISGYYYVKLSKDSKISNMSVASIVAINFLNHIRCGHNLTINHISGNKLDNNVDNLELVTSRQNKILSIDKNKTTSKYAGVNYHKKRNQWRSRICVNGITKYLGRFKTELEAHEAYQNKLKNI